MTRTVLAFALGALLGLVVAAPCAYAAEWCLSHPAPDEPTNHLLFAGQVVA